MTRQTIQLPAIHQRGAVAAELQPLLVDLIDLGLQAKQAHWNVVGPFFQSVHAQLDLIVADARGWSDDLAERMVALGVPARGQAANVAQSPLPALPEGTIGDRQALDLMIERLDAIVGRTRRSMMRLGDLDLASQDLVVEIVRGLEKHLWMLRAQTRS